MDKRIVYGYFYGKPLCFDGCATEKCRTWPHGNICGECKEYALVSPADLADLETQVVELTGLLKDLLGECYREGEMVEGVLFESRGAPALETCRKVAAHLKEVGKVHA